MSVRNVAEAIMASEGGADIIDIKDPSQGSLGRATSSTILAISHHHQLQGQIPVTAALGELKDLDDLQCAHLGRELESSGLSLVKVGTSGLADEDRGRSKFFSLHRLMEENSDRPMLMPAAYADAGRAQAPPVWEVLKWAGETTARFLLVDTFVKDGRGFFSWIDSTEYPELLGACREASVRLAIAGSLREDDFEILFDHPPDVVAVRGAACSGYCRQAGIDSNKVRRLRQLMEHHRKPLSR
ncbi:(5-formylfuran-3-yl)methyl phosphate synthase [bacterium]|nr:(5-formylfuran-3-yl)methyl phosphate synthase [bacterium]